MNARYNWVGLQTILIREIRRFLRIWPQTILPAAITMTLYFIIFGNLIGRRIGEMDGFSYIEYITPGIIMMSIINNAYSNVASSFYSAKFQSHIEELLIAPLSNSFILIGYLAGGVTRGLLVGIIVTIISLFFTDIHIAHPVITVSIILLSAILFALGGFINALYANSFDQISIVPTFILTPLTYLGGVFYSISLLPEIGQTASHFNPLFYLVNGFRYGMLGTSDVSPTTAFIIIVGCIIGLSLFALKLLKNGTGLRK